MNKEKATKVWKDYYGAVLAAAKDKKEVKGTELQDKAAKDNGFKDWTDFATKAAKSLGPDEWKKVTDEITKWYTAENEKLVKQMTEEATKKAEDAAKKE
ncbi:MAG: hypothetical protein MUC63_03380 [Planctomycetes bacterium]|nr:hypothetical protein [Planctomycetota bacterium]